MFTTNMEMQEMQSTYSSSIRDEWEQYNLKSENLIRNGVPMKYQVIVKENTPVSVFSNQYKLLPNEEALKVADEVTTSMGLVPATQIDSEFKAKLSTIPDVLYGKKNGIDTRMTAMYVNPSPIDLGVGSDSDPVLFGVGVRNSIDGSAGFGAFTFAFRQLCGNMSQHLQSAKMLQVSTADMTKIAGLKEQVLTSATFVHRESLKTEVIQTLISEVIKGADSVIKRFKQMKTEELTKQQALEISIKYGATVTKNVDWLSFNKKDKVFTPAVRGVTTFDAFQDITQILSHTAKIGYDGVNEGLQRADKILVRQELTLS